MKKTFLIISVFTFATLLIACQAKESGQPASPEPEKPIAAFKECKDPRPEMCTREYRPVCAKRDTGIRCVTTPCPSIEYITKSNACTACSDKKVFGYSLGACK